MIDFSERWLASNAPANSEKGVESSNRAPDILNSAGADATPVFCPGPDLEPSAINRSPGLGLTWLVHATSVQYGGLTGMSYPSNWLPFLNTIAAMAQSIANEFGFAPIADRKPESRRGAHGSARAVLKHGRVSHLDLSVLYFSVQVTTSPPDISSS